MVTATNIVMANEGHNRIIITWVAYDEFSTKYDTDPSNTVSSSDFLKYEIYRTTTIPSTLEAADLLEEISRREVKRWADGTAEEFQQYYYTVVWVNKDGSKEQYEWRGPYYWARPKAPSNLTSDYDNSTGGKSVILSWDPPTTEADSITPLVNFTGLAGYRLFWNIDAEESDIDWTYDVGGYGLPYEDRSGTGRSDGYGLGTNVRYYQNYVDISLSSLLADSQGIGATIENPKYKFSPLQLGKKYSFNIKSYDGSHQLIDIGNEALQPCIEIVFDAPQYSVQVGDTVIVETDIINCGIDLQEAYIEYRISVRSYGYGEDIFTTLLHNSESGTDSPLVVGSNLFNIPVNIADSLYGYVYGGHAYGYSDLGEYELCVMVYEDSSKTNLITSACVNIIPEGE